MRIDRKGGWVEGSGKWEEGEREREGEEESEQWKGDRMEFVESSRGRKEGDPSPRQE